MNDQNTLIEQPLTTIELSLQKYACGRDDEDVGVVYEDKSSQNHLCKPFTAT